MAQQERRRRGESPESAVDSDFFRRNRETIESIVIAVVLAFLFRTFLAEAFVIPTGSMAPTLMGRHVDVACDQCGYQYPAGASVENDNYLRAFEHTRWVHRTTCPMCRYSMNLARKINEAKLDPDHESFNGDRILVEKFTYNLWEPKRWDVIVFKYPGNAKQNYIKRLIGLPNESIRIYRGDIYVKPLKSDQPWRITHKPHMKQLSMMQLVHDTDYTARDLAKVDWPARWQPWTKTDGGETPTTRVSGDERNGFKMAGSSGEQWFRYYHFLYHRDETWNNEIDKSLVRPWLITDYYAYNDARDRSPAQNAGGHPHFTDDFTHSDRMGNHWVGDLCAEFDVQVKNSEGTIIFEIVEAGVHYQCHINVKSGQAKLTTGKAKRDFVSDDGETRVMEPLANTRLKGVGSYRVRFSNFDNQLRLWVNSRPVRFNAPTGFLSPEDERPKWSVSDPGDISPVAIGSRGTDLVVKRVRIHRDVYYVATRSGAQNDEYNTSISGDSVHDILHDPKSWGTPQGIEMFASREPLDAFHMKEGQFFPLGDNSPQSKDARYWSGTDDAEVSRVLLTGRALFIYWPHPWWRSVIPIPNFKRMKIIR